MSEADVEQKIATDAVDEATCVQSVEDERLFDCDIDVNDERLTVEAVADVDGKT